MNTSRDTLRTIVYRNWFYETDALNQPQNKFGCTSFAELCGWDMWAGTTTNLPIVLNIPKNSYLNQATPNFPTPKNPGIENFKPQKILRSSRHLLANIAASPPRYSRETPNKLTYSQGDGSLLLVLPLCPLRNTPRNNLGTLVPQQFVLISQ